MSRVIIKKYVILFVFFFGLLSNNYAFATYTITDWVTGAQTIKFNWTFQGKDVFGGYWVTIDIDGEEPYDEYIPFYDDPDLISFNSADGKDVKLTFHAPDDATDWKQTVTSPNGNSTVFSANIHKDSPWAFEELELLPDIFTRIPDLAPISGDPGLTLYTAVNLALYMNSNSLGFLDGAWSVGDTLSDLNIEIIDGAISGLEGISWATTPFEFNSDPTGVGFTPIGGDANLLNSSLVGYDIVVLQQHAGTPVPEPTTMLLFASGLIGFVSAQWKSNHKKTRCN